jgi:hypothetical protein
MGPAAVRGSAEAVEVNQRLINLRQKQNTLETGVIGRLLVGCYHTSEIVLQKSIRSLADDAAISHSIV